MSETDDFRAQCLGFSRAQPGRGRCGLPANLSALSLLLSRSHASIRTAAPLRSAAPHRLLHHHTLQNGAQSIRRTGSMRFFRRHFLVQHVLRPAKSGFGRPPRPAKQTANQQSSKILSENATSPAPAFALEQVELVVGLPWWRCVCRYQRHREQKRSSDELCNSGKLCNAINMVVRRQDTEKTR